MAWQVGGYQLLAICFRHHCNRNVGVQPLKNDRGKQASYIEVVAEVRYWEDATVNGVADIDGLLIPLREGVLWKPVIRLEDGHVQDWPEGTTADIHYKVADQGEYWLLDAQRARIAKWDGAYVPDAFLCHGDDGYGDYIILRIGGDGMVEGWTTPPIREAMWPAIHKDSADSTYTLTEAGAVLTETQHGITIPVDYSFATVNDYVHGVEVQFEDLVNLCLGMAAHIDKLGRPDCETCANLGKIDGMSQETHCEHCAHQEEWRTSHYKPKLENGS